MARHLIALVALLPLLFVPAIGPASAQMPGYPGAANPTLGDAAVRPVSQGELDRYLVVLEGMIGAGLDAGSELGMDPSNPAAHAAAVRYSEKVQTLVRGQGFDEKSFGEVHQNLMRAYMAETMSGHREEIEKARAEQQKTMAKMRESMSPEQAEAVMRAMSSATAMMESTADVPPENLALVVKNKARIEAVFEKAQRDGR